MDVRRGETVAVVGESGSGKSVSMRAILRMFPKRNRAEVAGSVRFESTNLLTATDREIRKVRGDRIALITQDALAALNPSLTVGYQIAEGLRVRRGWGSRRAMSRAAELLDMVGIPSAKERLSDYPHQFSGGMRQRVLIANGLSLEPDLLIADEPTTALDVTIQAQILQLLRNLRETRHMAVVLITHDMGVVAEMAERISVMYAGSVVESGPLRDVFASPKHPYTEGLLKAVPRPGLRSDRLVSIPGSPPGPAEWPSGCRFHTRCHYARETCSVRRQTLEEVGHGHYAACELWKDIFDGGD